jgi:hypothetical protein
MFSVIVIIANQFNQWEEDFAVPKNNKDFVEGYIQAIVDEFNNTLRPGETERKLITIKSIGPGEENIHEN